MAATAAAPPRPRRRTAAVNHTAAFGPPPAFHILIQYKFRSSCRLSTRFFAIRTCRPSPATSGRGRRAASATRWRRACSAPSRGVQVLVASQRPEGPAKGEIVTVHGLEGSGDAGYIRSLAAAALAPRLRRARLSHAHLRRHRAPLPDALSRRPHQRPERRAARLSDRRPRPGLPGGLLAGRQCGSQTGRRTGGARPGVDPRGLRGLDAARSGGLRPAPRPSIQPAVRAPLHRPHARPSVRHRPLPEAGLPGPALHPRDRRPHHRALVRLRRRGQLLPHAVVPSATWRPSACRYCSSSRGTIRWCRSTFSEGMRCDRTRASKSAPPIMAATWGFWDAGRTASGSTRRFWSGWGATDGGPDRGRVRPVAAESRVRRPGPLPNGRGSVCVGGARLRTARWETPRNRERQRAARAARTRHTMPAILPRRRMAGSRPRVKTRGRRADSSLARAAR